MSYYTTIFNCVDDTREHPALCCGNYSSLRYRHNATVQMEKISGPKASMRRTAQKLFLPPIRSKNILNSVNGELKESKLQQNIYKYLINCRQ